jgi:hypothetical protein
MSDPNNPLDAEKTLLAEASKKPFPARLGTYAKLSGPEIGRAHV